MDSIENAKAILRDANIIKDAAKKIYASLTFGKQPSQNPTAIIIGAQPGAGKSGLAISSLQSLGENAIELDVDFFRAFALPYIGDVLKDNPDMFVPITGEFYNTMNAIIQPRLINEGYDLVFHRTFRSAAPLIEDTITPLKEQNYNIIIRSLAVHELESFTSSIERAQALREQTGLTRWVYPNYHSNNYTAIPAVLAELTHENYANCVQVFKRGATPDKPVMICSKILTDVSGQPNADELCEYNYNADKPMDQVLNDGRNENLPALLQSMPGRIEKIQAGIKTAEETQMVDYLKDLYQSYQNQSISPSNNSEQ